MVWVRSLLFHLGLLPPTIFFALLAFVVYPLPYRWRYYIITSWTRLVLWWLSLTCGLRYRVTGRDNVPQGPAIVFCKHQSAWETLALTAIFPPQTWILKREMLWLPLIGWGLAALDPIAINRRAKLHALQQVLQQGLARLDRGRWLIIFPEGTRVAPGDKRRYQSGGGVIAERTGYPVVIVAHNAGLFWPRNSFVKYPGMIDVVIGPTIEPKDKTAREIMVLAEQWIEQTSERLLRETHPPARKDPAIKQNNYETGRSD